MENTKQEIISHFKEASENGQREYKTFSVFGQEFTFSFKPENEGRPFTVCMHGAFNESACKTIEAAIASANRRAKKLNQKEG